MLQRAAVRRITVPGSTGSEAAHGGAQKTAPPPRRGEGVKVATCTATTISTFGQQMLATVVQVRIVVRAETAAIAAVATVVAAAVAPPQSQPKEIPIVVGRIGEILKIQMRLVLKVAIYGNGGCDDHKLTILLAAIRLLLLLLLMMMLLLLLAMVALLVGQRVEQRLVCVHRGVTIAVRHRRHVIVVIIHIAAARIVVIIAVRKDASGGRLGGGYSCRRCNHRRVVLWLIVLVLQLKRRFGPPLGNWS